MLLNQQTNKGPPPTHLGPGCARDRAPRAITYNLHVALESGFGGCPVWSPFDIWLDQGYGKTASEETQNSEFESNSFLNVEDGFP